MAQGAAQIYGKGTVKMANKMAKSQINAAEKPVRADQAAARAALQGYGLAAAAMLKGVGPADQQAYSQAAGEEANLAQGFSGAAQGQVQDAQQQSDAFRQQMAPGSSSQETVNPSDLGNSLYDLAGYIPGSSLESQGAAAAAWGNAQPGIQASHTENDIMASDATYAKQLLSIASQEPALRQSILSTLYKDELSGQAESLVNAKFGEQVRMDNNTVARDKALTAQGNERVQQGQVRLQLQGQSLVLRQQSQKLALQKANRQGRQVDMNTSKARGYYVDNNGDPITTPNGKRIPYNGTASQARVGGNGAGGKGGANTGPGSTSYKEAYRYAANTYATQYVSPGVPDPTQSNPPFVKMQNYLVRAYGVTKGQARKILIGNGVKPDGKRAGKK